MVCFKCGKNGHNEEECPMLSTDKNPAMAAVNDQLENISIESNVVHSKILEHRPEVTEDYGSWMLVKKPPRKRNPRPEKTNVTGVNTTIGGPVIFGKNGNMGTKQSTPIFQAQKGGSGSRFSILQATNKENPINIDTLTIPLNQNSNSPSDPVIEGGNPAEKIFPTVDLIVILFQVNQNLILVRNHRKHRIILLLNFLTKPIK